MSETREAKTKSVIRACLVVGTIAVIHVAHVAHVSAQPSNLPPTPGASVLASPISATDQPADPWRVALLPKQTLPATRFDVTEVDGQRVLRVRADRSYGNLLHPVQALHAQARRLRWSWRVDAAPAGDLRTKQGDDVALKICALFDWPRDRLSISDRAQMALGSLLTGESLPTATMCYVVDAAPAAQSAVAAADGWMPNAYTGRIHMLTVRGADVALGAWTEHTRDLHADFKRAFADEWRDGDAVPALRAVLVGADTDNTASVGLGYLRSIDLR